MDIDTKTHHADISTSITDNGVEKDLFSPSEALSIITVLNRYSMDFVDVLRQEAVRVDMEIEKEERNE